MELISLLALAIGVGVVAFGLYGISFLKNKGILTNENVETTKMTITILEMILKNIKFNETYQNEAERVFAIAKVSVGYVEQVMKNDDNVIKKETAFNTTLEILKTLDIEVTDDIKTLIEFGIESAVNTLPKTNKELM